MKYLVSNSRYLVLIGVFASLVTAVLAFVWGAYKTVMMAVHMYEAMAGDAQVVRVELIAIMDVFLIATALYIFGVGLYLLFIGKVDLPGCLAIDSLHDLKIILSRVVLMVMAVTFLEHLVSWKSGSETLMLAGAIAVVMAALIAYGWLAQERKQTDGGPCDAGQDPASTGG